LFEAIEVFLNRLNICAQISQTATVTEIIIKIMAELLFTLAVVTKQTGQTRARKCVLSDTLLN
jgi:hypothetical protein